MANKPRILVVDDDESVRKTISVMLEDADYLVDTAKTGEEAVKKSETNFYNLALLDIRLPDMEGTRLLTEMKDTVPKMVKIMLTGYPSMDNAVDAVNKGADGYIVKPVNTEELLATIREHLKRQKGESRYSEDKVKDFIETRVRQLEPP